MVKFIVPPFVNHDGGAIYSIDSHPSGEKFLTCGQREESSGGIIMIWNSGPILSESHYNDKSIPRILCQISSQAGANCCRWSPDGKRFAVGSDDSTVSIWEFVGRVNSAGSVLGKAANIERYKESATLRTHAMEVICVEWSQNGKYLASSSMDNLICIWNAKKLPERITTLKGHEGVVKGLCWDPIGKYFASFASDKKLKIWQTDNWQCATTIEKPFESSGQTTMFARLDWSPDGKYLFAPSATNNNAPTVQIVERQTWSVERDLVGHRKATTCVRVLPRIICSTTKNGKKMQFTCVAVGSRDKSISIWLLPGISRPLFVMNKVFKHSVMDMAWNDLSLTACSQDGSVVTLVFDETSLGEALTASAMSDLCHSMYCIRPPQYDEENGMAIEEDNNGSIQMANDSINNSSFLTCPEDVIARRQKEEQEKKTVEAENGKTENSEATTETVVNEAITKNKESEMKEKRSEQVEVQGKDGKRRVQPIFLASTASGEVISSTIASSTTLKRKLPTVSQPLKNKDDGEDLEEESTSEEDDDEDEEDEEEEMEIDETDDERRNGRKRRKEKTTKQPLLAMDFRKPTLRPVELPSMKVVQGTVVMDAIERQPTIVQNVIDRKNMLLEIDNKWRHSGVETSSVRLVKRKVLNSSTIEHSDEPETSNRTTSETVWMLVVGAPIIIASANKNFCVLGCGDRCLRVYKTNCASLVTCVKLDSLPVSIGVREYAAYVLTEYGKLSTWNLQSMKCVLSRQPIFECVESSKDISLASLDVSETGIPLMVLSNGAVYTYNIGLSSWIQVVSSSVISRLAAPLNDSQLSDGPLGRLLKRMRKTATVPNVAPVVSRAVKESQMEQILHSAEVLGNAQDYQAMLNLYVETLCEHGSEKKLKNLIGELSKNGAPMLICGVRRTALVADLIKLVEQRQPAIAARVTVTAQPNTRKISLF